MAYTLAPSQMFSTYLPPAPAKPVASNPTGTLGAGPVSGYNPAYGGVPSVPDPAQTQLSSLLANLGNLSSLYNLTTGTSGASAAGAEQQLEQNLPGYPAARNAAMANAQSLIGGNVPTDVWNQLAQRAAERGVALGGTPDSPNANAALLSALGQTSLGLQQQGQQNLAGLVGMTPTGPQFNPASMLLNPQSQQEWQYLANTLAAAPIPASAAAANIGALQRGVGQGFRQPQGGTPFNFIPPNPFQQQQPQTPFVGGVQVPPVGRIDPNAQATMSSMPDFANMTEDQLMNYINGFPWNWQGEPLGQTTTDIAGPQQAPTDTFYNPSADTMTYDPTAGLGLGDFYNFGG